MIELEVSCRFYFSANDVRWDWCGYLRRKYSFPPLSHDIALWMGEELFIISQLHVSFNCSEEVGGSYMFVVHISC